MRSGRKGLTISHPQGLEGGSGLHSVGCVNEIKGGTEDSGYHIGKFLPGTVHTETTENTTLH